MRVDRSSIRIVIKRSSACTYASSCLLSRVLMANSQNSHAIEHSVGRVVMRYAGPAKKADHDDTVESIGSNEDGA